MLFLRMEQRLSKDFYEETKGVNEGDSEIEYFKIVLIKERMTTLLLTPMNTPFS